MLLLQISATRRSMFLLPIEKDCADRTLFREYYLHNFNSEVAYSVLRILADSNLKLSCHYPLPWLLQISR